MPSDYRAIRAENERKYGTDIGRIGPMLLADRYDTRAHFIFELLQNAEDALRRHEKPRSRSVHFELDGRELRFSHFGVPFGEPDVRGLCGIGETTKDLTAIGRFGIGFKSVYSFTDRPQVHSGDEHFEIENFVWPICIPPVSTTPELTMFVLPLREDDPTAPGEISAGLERIGARSLLFLREVEEISWSVQDGASGSFIRSAPVSVGAGARRIVLIGEETGKDPLEETWLVFSREIHGAARKRVGHVEIAFKLSESDACVEPVLESNLVVYFPTVVSTNLGVLVQGPYRTTPSRDNVPRGDRWNQDLVRETASLFVESLEALAGMDLLDVRALQALPLDAARFPDSHMFRPVFTAVLEAMQSKPLVPTSGGGHRAARDVRLARTKELRELVSASQLGALCGVDRELFWVTGEITSDRNAGVRTYLTQSLGVQEITPEFLLTRLSDRFLEAQSDDWIRQLYEFLLGQPALLRQDSIRDRPLVRREDGRHVAARGDGQPAVFLPGSARTGFPTAKLAVCSTGPARSFLVQLGLSEPDLVDDIVRNVLPKYSAAEVSGDEDEYASDISRIIAAYRTDSKGQREKLLSALRSTPFVMAVDAGDGSAWVSKPGDVYLATQRFKELFDGVPEVFLVDESYESLRGEEVRQLLEACGTSRYLEASPVPSRFSAGELTEMRIRAGFGAGGAAHDVTDFTLRGLDPVLQQLQRLPHESASRKATLLWEALCEVRGRREGIFEGLYRWFYYSQRSCSFDAAFVARLNSTAWVPSKQGRLERPPEVLFKDTGWQEESFLLSRIHFKPPVIEELAREAGIEPGALELLKRMGLTSEAELKARLGAEEDPPQEGVGTRACGDAAVEGDDAASEDAPRPALPTGRNPSDGALDASTENTDTGTTLEATTHAAERSPDGENQPANKSHPSPGRSSGISRDRSGTSSAGNPSSTDRRSGGRDGDRGAPQGAPGNRAPKDGTCGPFISYVAASTSGELERDPDGLEHDERLALEEQAISLVLRTEPTLQRTKNNNPGFDLIELGADGKQLRFVEVKAMTGSLDDRPATLSYTQFTAAQEHAAAYWLYIVERAGSPNDANVVRIQDPARKTGTLTFDRGWRSVAAGVPSVSHGAVRPVRDIRDIRRQ